VLIKRTTSEKIQLTKKTTWIICLYKEVIKRSNNIFNIFIIINMESIPSRSYYSNGKIRAEKYHTQDGTPHGMSRYWRDDGTILYEEPCKLGKAHGHWKWWHDNNELSWDQYYENGELMWSKKFDTSGNFERPEVYDSTESYEKYLKESC